MQIVDDDREEFQGISRLDRASIDTGIILTGGILLSRLLFSPPSLHYIPYVTESNNDHGMERW